MTSITSDKGQLVYSKTGSGPTPLLAFHGFGQDKSIFHPWGHQLAKTYTIYSFDLFYHGESNRADGKLTKSEWKEFIDQFLEEEGLDSFAVLGYSLGGRFAITTALQLPERTKDLILIGPDGVFLTIWFKLATSPMLKWLFKYVMLHPNRLDQLMALNKSIKIIDKYTADFVKKEMGNVKNRKKVYAAWNHFKPLGYSRKQLIKAFSTHSFTRRIILGKKDRIIKAKDILPIINEMRHFKVDIVPFKHHQLVNKEVAKLLLKTNTP